MGTARETTSMLSSLRTKCSERQEASYPAPGSVSLLPLIKIHTGVVLDAETDGEFVYAALEFGSATNRALYLSTMRDVYGDVDTTGQEAGWETAPLGTTCLGIAFLAKDYYL
jgi:hypothetical protein